MPVRGVRCTLLGCFTVAAAVVAPLAPGVGGEMQVSLGGNTFHVPMVSLREARFQTVVRQQYDYSCGSAAVASLLTYHYERPTSEMAVFQAMFEAGDREKIQREGFSLLDMKNYLATQDLRADGYKMPLDKLAEIGVPAITLINSNGYRHFVLIKGIDDGKIVIGDPALGVKIMNIEEFKEIWGDVIFLIRDEADVARANFNHERDWRVRQKAPFGTALSRDALANFTLLSTFMQNEF